MLLGVRRFGREFCAAKAQLKSIAPTILDNATGFEAQAQPELHLHSDSLSSSGVFFVFLVSACYVIAASDTDSAIT